MHGIVLFERVRDMEPDRPPFAQPQHRAGDRPIDGDNMAGASVGDEMAAAHRQADVVALQGAEPLGGVPHIAAARPCRHRSEEHTSELQSLMRISSAAFCLKKKNKHNYNRYNNSESSLTNLITIE